MPGLWRPPPSQHLLIPPPAPCAGRGEAAGSVLLHRCPQDRWAPNPPLFPDGPIAQGRLSDGAGEEGLSDGRQTRQGLTDHYKGARPSTPPMAKAEELQFPLQATSVLRLPRKTGLTTLYPSWRAFCQPRVPPTCLPSCRRAALSASGAQTEKSIQRQQVVVCIYLLGLVRQNQTGMKIKSL